MPHLWPSGASKLATTTHNSSNNKFMKLPCFNVSKRNQWENRISQILALLFSPAAIKLNSFICLSLCLSYFSLQLLCVAYYHVLHCQKLKILFLLFGLFLSINSTSKLYIFVPSLGLMSVVIPTD